MAHSHNNRAGGIVNGNTATNYKLIIAYRGTEYKGWQKTSLGRSIEEMLEKSIFQIHRQQVRLQAASRTDAGVHAEGQVVNFLTDAPISDLRRFLHGLNGTLPQDIRILCIEPMPAHFHPTTDAIGKHYTYWICNHQVQLPFYRHLSWHFPYPLDIALMQKESQHLLGAHDFSSFCNERSLWTRNPVCTIDAINILLYEENRLSICFKGDHFLYKMVRNLAGTLAYVGCGKIPPNTIPSILEKKARALAGVTAPAHGLTLKEVFYPSFT